MFRGGRPQVAVESGLEVLRDLLPGRRRPDGTRRRLSNVGTVAVETDVRRGRELQGRVCVPGHGRIDCQGVGVKGDVVERGAAGMDWVVGRALGPLGR